jgi:cell division protein ZapA (FtsZ GTPase activity inhibitor)
MSISTIIINGRKLSVHCRVGDEERLKEVAEKLDLEVRKIATKSPNSSFDLLVTLVALQLMDDKMSGQEAVAGEVLREAKQDFQQQMSVIMNELKAVATKLEN